MPCTLELSAGVEAVYNARDYASEVCGPWIAEFHSAVLRMPSETRRSHRRRSPSTAHRINLVVFVRELCEC